LQFRLLKLQDSQRNTTLKQFKTKELELQRELQASTFAYGEAMKQREVTDFALKSKTPFIQSIDKPLPPLSPNKNFSTYLSRLIFGGFIGTFLAIAFIVGRKVIRDTMKE